MSLARVPVVVLTGHLGSGKTTLLNHLLHRPGARVGVVVNDFGAINVDAALVSGQVDEPASIAGGCICCLPDAGGLDDALRTLTDPRRGLDVVIVEASGLAEPATLARLVRFSPVERVRAGGVIEVVDAAEYFNTLDDGRGEPPLRFDAASLVVVNKIDRVPARDRDTRLARIANRVAQRNPSVRIVPAQHARIDPDLIYDAAESEDPPGQLPFAAAARAEYLAAHRGEHIHAGAVTVTVPGPVQPGALLALLNDPPPTAYRIKGTVLVGGPRARRYLVNVVGGSLDIDELGPAAGTSSSELVAIGVHLAAEEVRPALQRALVRSEAPSRREVSTWRRLARSSRAGGGEPSGTMTAHG